MHELLLTSDAWQRTAAHAAARAGCVQAFEGGYLSFLSQRDFNGDTAVHLAAAAGHKRIVESLLKGASEKVMGALLAAEENEAPAEYTATCHAHSTAHSTVQTDTRHLRNLHRSWARCWLTRTTQSG